jgi:hypothetical protein
MQEPNGLNDEQLELESALRSLPPAAARIDPITAAFTAGRRASRRQLRLWRSAAVLILLVGAASRLVSHQRNVTIQPRDLSENKIVLSPEQPPPEPPAPQSLQALQQIVREKGLDAMPSANLPTIQATGMRDIWNPST